MSNSTTDRRPSAAEVRQIWDRWRSTGDARDRNRLVMMYSGMVRHLVLKKAQELPTRCEIDDLVSCGLIALIESIERWDPAKGAPLEQLAWTRVQGAILDELRRQDWAPRSIRRAERQIAAAEDRFVAAHGRKPTSGELAEASQMTHDDLLSVRRGIDRAVVGSLHAPARRSETDVTERIDTLPTELDGPQEATERNDARRRLRAALANMPVRERQVAELLYVRGLSQREAAGVLELTESRVSQIHTRLRNGLRLVLADQADAFEYVS